MCRPSAAPINTVSAATGRRGLGASPRPPVPRRSEARRKEVMPPASTEGHRMRNRVLTCPAEIAELSAHNCLETLRRPTASPTRRAMSSLPRRRDPRLRTIRAISSSRFSMAWSNSSRLRRRSSRSRGLKQTISRSPGKSGLAISATASWTGTSAVSGPFASFRMSVDFSAEIQSRPAGTSSSRMRALAAMPRSPTKATRPRPKRRRILSICRPTVDGSAALPSKTSIATGHPSRSHRSPYVICRLSRRPSRLWPNAASAVLRPST